MYEELIKAVEQRKHLESQLDNKKRLFAESIAIEQATVQDLKALEEKLREAVMLKMKEEGKEVQTIGENSINLCTKITRKISDPNELLNSLIYNKEKIDSVLKDENVDSIVDKCFKKEYKIEDKDKVLDIVNSFQSIEGKLLNGITDQVTEYLTVK